MDISLIVPLKYLEFVIQVGETHMEGSMSQNFDNVFSFCLIVCRRWDFVKILKKSKKVTRFLLQNKN